MPMPSPPAAPIPDDDAPSSAGSARDALGAAVESPRASRRATWSAFAAGALTMLALLVVSSCSYLWPGHQPGRGSTPADLAAAAAQTADGEPILRVRLAARSREAVLDGPAELLIQPRQSPSHAGRYATPVRVEIGLRGWRLQDGDGAVTLIQRSGDGPAHDVLRIVSPASQRARAATAALPSGAHDDRAPAASTAPVRVTDGDGDVYALPGEVWLHGRGGLGDRQNASPPGAARVPSFDIVERVPIEAYLPGVIAKELYANWRLETFKAQAVAARSYALHERQRRMARGSHFDIENTTRSQVYAGLTENRTALDAVRDTRGQVLTWNGHLVRAYYSSTTGGRAVGAGEIWPTTNGFEFNLMPPIQASPRDDSDAFSPLHRWRVVRDRAELTRRIRGYAHQQGFNARRLAKLAGIEPAETNAFGRPIAYRLIDESGRSWTMNAEHLRMACNYPVGELGPPGRNERVNSSDLEASFDGSTVTIRGRGFGHGVGMSQFGAEGKARRGETYLAILAHFYPGAEIEDRY